MVISTPIPPEEGIGYYATNLSKELLSRGHKVTILTRGGVKGETFEFEGIRVERVPFVPLYPFHVDIHGLFVNRALERLEPSPDIVHVHTPLTPVVDTEVPVVSTIHTSVVEDAAQISSFDAQAIANKIVTRLTSKRIIQQQSEQTRAITTVACSVKSEVEKHFDISGVQVVGNGVDISEFERGFQEADEDFGLFVGRLSYRKGISDLVAAWEDLPAEQRIPLKIVGKGPLRNQLEENIIQSGLEDDVQMLGHVSRERLIQLYKQAAFSIVPSHYEGLPTVLLEAMAAKTAVVATSVSGALDVIEDEKNGILVPPRDPESLSKAITDLLEDSELRARLAKNGREIIEERYTWDAVADRYLSVYQEEVEA